MEKQHAVITGDIISSRKVDVQKWLPILQQSLQYYSNNFDIFRGDSFQIAVPIEHCIEAIFLLKSTMRTVQPLDVRVGLGIGEISYLDLHIKNSAGDALINSGEAFDTLEKNFVGVKSPWSDWDETTTIMLQLATELANRWTFNMAETVSMTIKNPSANQRELAKLLNRKYQSQISTELGNANWHKIKIAIDYCTKELIKRC
ncbi:hypothetical protein [Sphingobacterium bovistauri]|uniref:SatD family (SatD) n=1 Tax=Sphingobacterium bovistauri TaxID=2781959 RepID=A0ABS7ZDF6_9SPHI|nr:hypothetical protein [Sphingobacterium bovistauri]MCA5006764.1 hypothetical protein [Sphingobacterium bovistauri]